MGTSKGYKMPTGGEWTPLKTEATNFLKPNTSQNSPEKLLSLYFKTRMSNSNGKGSGGGSAGGGGSFGGTVMSTGQSLGGFLSSVQDVGLTETLREAGLSDLIGKSFSQIKKGLLNFFTSSASSLEDHAVREALMQINDEIVNNLEDYDDVEDALRENIDQKGIAGIIQSFFGKYIFQLFCQDFYEVWVKKEGEKQASEQLEEVRDCIDQAIESKLIKTPATSIDWKGNEGINFVNQIKNKTRRIFGLG